jgi:hypothetical protein
MLQPRTPGCADNSRIDLVEITLTQQPRRRDIPEQRVQAPAPRLDDLRSVPMVQHGRAAVRHAQPLDRVSPRLPDAVDVCPLPYARRTGSDFRDLRASRASPMRRSTSLDLCPAIFYVWVGAPTGSEPFRWRRRRHRSRCAWHRESGRLGRWFGAVAACRRGGRGRPRRRRRTRRGLRGIRSS